ncbi:HlyD family efflux transporter periplasmic adaptor subunit [Prosthecobacter sp.]|uniref:efflux RND transporter periplasmic adaptor subunit n=1 Tax=Prosthecobacter sp. TaxID=1965333 RepID=UPI001D4FBD07|nr:HlyD family efflux transporter periplasmic adaptor subunit [Prosthecobacter sp.]MCB1278420.1 HlyD family efflux transporter periplasmic adaptor subunit [Prosthecobacter sp.]
MPDASTETPKAAVPPWEAKTPITRRSLSRKVVFWSIAGALVLLMIYALQPRPVEIETGVVHQGPLTVYVSEEGKTRIRNRYVVAAPVAGSMQRVTLKPGDTVKAGETVLTRIEPALSPLLDARARSQAQARVDAALATRSRANEDIEMARTGLKYAQANWDRVKNNTDKGTISDTDRDTFQREAEMKVREVRSTEFALQVADFELAQARAALEQIDKPAAGGASIEVKAPVNGLVLRVQQESATIVTPGTPILELGDPTDLEIEAEILSRDAVAIKPGAHVTVEQWGGDEPAKATVRRVEPAAFTKVSALGVEEQRVLVLSDFVEQTPALKALGDRYRVEVRVAVWHSDDTLLVPAGALFREGSEWKTFLYDDGNARVVVVKAGRTDGKLTQVLEGLKVGDEVLVHPPDTVKDGTSVVKRLEVK